MKLIPNWRPLPFIAILAGLSLACGGNDAERPGSSTTHPGTAVSTPEAVSTMPPTEPVPMTTPTAEGVTTSTGTLDPGAPAPVVTPADPAGAPAQGAAETR